MRYTVEYYETQDRQPCWCVVQWVWGSDGEIATTVKQCASEDEAESFARAYTLINAYAY